MNETTLVIPDGIEPMVGYKYLHLDADGLLQSPHAFLAWVPHKAAEAGECNDGNWTWRPLAFPPAGEFYASEGDPAITSGVPGPPLIELPQGLSWYLVADPHSAPQENCTCGIYSVSAPIECGGYAAAERVLVELALWGRIIPGSKGSRAEFAYPKALHITGAREPSRKRITEAAELYGVPCVDWTGETPENEAPHVQAAAALLQLAAVPHRSRSKLDAITANLPGFGAILLAIISCFFGIAEGGNAILPMAAFCGLFGALAILWFTSVN